MRWLFAAGQPKRHASMAETELTIKTVAYVHRMVRPDISRSLEQVEGPGSVTSFPIPKEKNEMVIGRAKDADIHVRSNRISRHHAVLERKGPDWTVRDNDSVNGVLLNGVKIFSAVLRDGDVIQTGDSTFVYHEG
jgi:pSer/pThr/pTyr-binding forkhead associated (FHA) protein